MQSLRWRKRLPAVERGEIEPDADLLQLGGSSQGRAGGDTGAHLDFVCQAAAIFVPRRGLICPACPWSRCGDQAGARRDRHGEREMQPFNVGDLVVYEALEGRALTVSAVRFDGPRWWLAFKGYPKRYWSLASLFRLA